MKMRGRPDARLGLGGKRGQNKKRRRLRLFAALRPAAYANRLAELPVLVYLTEMFNAFCPPEKFLTFGNIFF
jgi:hypothetical protein